MIFNSIQFLVFFPIVFMVYFLLPARVRYIWLLISSYYFYMCWNPKYIFLILFSTVITYISGLSSDDNLLGDNVLAWNTIENHLELWRILRPQDIWPMMKAYPVYLKKCLGLFVSGRGNGSPEGCYSRHAFNEYGDIALERAASKYTFESPVIAPTINDTAIDRINALSEWLSQKGATLLVAGYPIGKGVLTAPDEEFVKAQNELTKRLSCPVISDYRDYMFDYSLFYDTELHLTTEGAVLRTQQLIEDLQQWMRQDAEP